jgi:hypothetical protein
MSEDQSGSDDTILAQVASMCDLLGLKRFTPKRLVWEDTFYLGRGRTITVPVDYVFVGGRQMTLAKRMRGILSPEEWRPLIGSTLLVRSWARPRAIKALTVGIIAALAYYIPVLFLFFETSVLGTAGIYLSNPLFPLLIGLLTFALFTRAYSPEAHKEALRADLQVAGIVGRGLFVDVLQKIDSMGFKDVEKLDRKSSRFKQPSIQERIRNLQSGGTVASVSQ